MAKKALVIGINAYSPPNALPSCVNDADAFAKYLETQNGFHAVTNFRDAQATRTAILAGIRTLLADARDSDELVLYFSGHGYSYQDGDAHIDALVSQDSKFLTTDDMSAATASAPPGALTVVLDSCFSGGMQKVFALTEGVRPVKIKFWTPPNPDERSDGAEPNLPPIRVYKAFGAEEGIAPDILAIPPETAKAFSLIEPQPIGVTRHFILLSACRGDETAAASTDRTEGRSAFTYSFLKAIAGESASASVATTVESAGRILRSLGVTQTPMLKVPKNPAHLENQPFLQWGAPASKGAPGSGAPILLPPSISTPQKGQSMGQAAFDKDWLSDISSIVQTVTPVIANALKDYQPPLSGFNPPTPMATTDKAWFDNIARVVATVVPAVVQGMRTLPPPSKGFSAQAVPFDKGWFDNLTSIAVAVVPHVVAALKNADPRGSGALSEVAAAAQKGWFDDVARTVVHILPVVLNAVQQAPAAGPQASKGFEVLSSNGVDEKGFLDIVSQIARVAVPLAVSIL
jgi:hypothetical protein